MKIFRTLFVGWILFQSFAALSEDRPEDFVVVGFVVSVEHRITSEAGNLIGDSPIHVGSCGFEHVVLDAVETIYGEPAVESKKFVAKLGHGCQSQTHIALLPHGDHVLGIRNDKGTYRILWSSVVGESDSGQRFVMYADSVDGLFEVLPSTLVFDDCEDDSTVHCMGVQFEDFVMQLQEGLISIDRLSR